MPMKVTHADKDRAQTVARVMSTLNSKGYRTVSKAMLADGHNWATPSVVHRLMRLIRDQAKVQHGGGPAAAHAAVA